MSRARAWSGALQNRVINGAASDSRSPSAWLIIWPPQRGHVSKSRPVNARERSFHVGCDVLAGTDFSRAIHQHINSPGVRAIEGTCHKQAVTHYLDPSTGLNVMADPAGNFISGWRLSPAQAQNVLTHGGL